MPAQPLTMHQIRELLRLQAAHLSQPQIARALNLSLGAVIRPILVASYFEELTNERAPQTVKQHLAAIRMLFDWLVTGQVVPFNPASSVRGPRYSIKKGKTPVLSVEEMRRLLDSIDSSSIIGLRDRALIGLMVYSFGRVSAITAMRVKDHFPKGRRTFIRLHE